MYFGFTTRDLIVVENVEFGSSRKCGEHGQVPSRISSNSLAMTTLSIWLLQIRKLLRSSLIIKDWLSDGNDWFIISEVFCLVIRPDPTIGISLESCSGVTLVEWSFIVTGFDTM